MIVNDSAQAPPRQEQEAVDRRVVSGLSDMTQSIAAKVIVEHVEDEAGAAHSLHGARGDHVAIILLRARGCSASTRARSRR